KFYLVDLPGYGYAKVPKSMSRSWGELVRGYLETADELKTIFLLVDARRTPGEHDRQMHEWARDLDGVSEKIVLTKTDKLSNNELAVSRRAIAKELEMDEADLIASSVVN